jgi:serine protease AprX
MHLSKTPILIILLVLIQHIAYAQTRYLVKFKNKAFQTASLSSPSSYLSARSIARREKYNIPIDSTDLPVTPRYIDSLRSIPNVTVLIASKWLNQVSIYTSDPTALAKINSFSFVQSTNAIAARINGREMPMEYKFESPLPSNTRVTDIEPSFNYGLSTAQIKIHNGDFLHNIGLRGQGMIIGMLDAGYYLYTTFNSLDSINHNGQILDTYDFVQQETSVVEDDPHGMQCLSVIAANIPGQFVGTAPKAHFFLYRSEDVRSEYPIEEHNWVVAAERVDSAGGDVISSSLGYTTFDNPAYNHSYADMNGNTTIASIGADLAAKKGILVLNAAGNDGNNGWKYIATPADADSILTVGAVNTSGVVGAFSSYGPSADGQIKPDVASVGVGTVLQGNNVIATGNGTSFACPNLAGLATCLWQGFPEYNNIFIANVIRRSGHLFSTPNDRIGYGIPDMKKAVMLLLKEFASSSVVVQGCTPVISWKSKDITGMKYEIERKANGEALFTKIGEQKALGSTFSTQTYQFKDGNPFTQSGTISYRIRQVIDTATASFSADYIDTSSTSISSLCTINQITIAPNPAAAQVTIQITILEAILDLQIQFTNILGQEVKRVTYNKPAGSTIFPISIHVLPSGKYFVTVYNKKEKLYTQELIKLP